eukprot:ANDGO_08391.mRNA.1 hypothetical protein
MSICSFPLTPEVFSERFESENGRLAHKSSEEYGSRSIQQNLSYLLDSNRRMFELLGPFFQSTRDSIEAVDMHLTRVSTHLDRVQDAAKASSSRIRSLMPDEQTSNGGGTRNSSVPALDLDGMDAQEGPSFANSARDLWGGEEAIHEIGFMDPKSVWRKVLSALDEGSIEDAYSIALENGDDVMVARLMRQTGPSVLDTIQEPWCMLLVNKCISFLRMREFVVLGLDFMERSFDLQMSISLQQRRILESALHELCSQHRELDEDLVRTPMQGLNAESAAPKNKLVRSRAHELLVLLTAV